MKSSGDSDFDKVIILITSCIFLVVIGLLSVLFILFQHWDIALKILS